MKRQRDPERNFVVGSKYKYFKYFSATNKSPKDRMMLPNDWDGTMFKTRDEATYWFNRLPTPMKEKYEVRPAYSEPSMINRRDVK